MSVWSLIQWFTAIHSCLELHRPVSSCTNCLELCRTDESRTSLSAAVRNPLELNTTVLSCTERSGAVQHRLDPFRAV